MVSVDSVNHIEQRTEGCSREKELAKKLAEHETLVLDLRAEVADQEANHQKKLSSLSEQLQQYAFARSELEAQVRKDTKRIEELQTELKCAEEDHMAQIMSVTSSLRDALVSLDDSEAARHRLEATLHDRELQLQKHCQSAGSFDEEMRNRVQQLEGQAAEQTAEHAAKEKHLTSQIQEYVGRYNELELEVERLKTQINCERGAANQLLHERDIVISSMREQLDVKNTQCLDLTGRLQDARSELERVSHCYVEKRLVASGLYAYFEQSDPRLKQDILGTLLDTMELSADDDHRLRRFSRCMREQLEAEVRELKRRAWGQLAGKFVSFLNEEVKSELTETPAQPSTEASPVNRTLADLLEDNKRKSLNA